SVPSTSDTQAKPKPWNEHPRDLANLSQWMGERIEEELNWQVVNLQVSPDDLHDAPILYLSGNEALDFGEADVAKLREFVEDGGMILGNADCDNLAFVSSFEKLGRRLFPKYEFRELPAEHLIYTEELFKKFKTRPRLLGLSNDVRELMVLMPSGDPARWWQSRSAAFKPELF